MNKIDISSWREFKVGDLFPVIIKPSVIHAKSVIESKSGTPYVVRSKFNNGIKCRVEKSVDFKPSPAGTISFGAENASFFYQAEEYISGRDIYYLDTRNLSKHACFFLIACLQSLTHKYSYNYGLFPDLLKKEYIKLPATADGKPDWQYMEQYISNKEKQVAQWLDTLQNISHLGGGRRVDNQYWREYFIGDIFNIRNGKGITQHEIYQHPGSLPAIQSGAEHNGCIGYISKEYCISRQYTLSDGACLTVARSGSSGHITYQPTQCVVGDSAKILQPKRVLTKEILLFLRSVLMVNKRKYAYSDKVTTKAYATDTILLPSTPDGKPDWEYMDAYMRHLESQQILSYLQFLQKKVS